MKQLFTPGQTTGGQALAFAQHPAPGKRAGAPAPGQWGHMLSTCTVAAVSCESLLCKSEIEQKAHRTFSLGCPAAPLYHPLPRILLRVIILSQSLAPWRRKQYLLIANRTMAEQI